MAHINPDHKRAIDLLGTLRLLNLYEIVVSSSPALCRMPTLGYLEVRGFSCLGSPNPPSPEP